MIKKRFLQVLFLFCLSILIVSCSKNNKEEMKSLSDFYSWSSDLKIESIIKVEIESKTLGTGPDTIVNKKESKNDEDIKYNFALLKSPVFKKTAEYVDGGSSIKLIYYTNYNSYEIEIINGYFRTDSEYSYYILDEPKILYSN